MKINKKYFFIVLALFAFQMKLSADTQWTGTSGTIPTDDLYYISIPVALTGELIVPTGATLEIRGSVSNDYTITINGGTVISEVNIYNGNSVSSTGNINISSGGTFTVDGGICYNGNGASSTGNINISSGGIINLNAGAGSGIISGYGASSTGNITIPDGTININGGRLINGDNASSAGNITMSGGAISLNSGLYYNAFVPSSTGNLNISGGAFTVSSGVCYNGYDTSSTGNINISSGGEFVMSGGELRNAGTSAVGNISISGGAFIMNGGTTSNAYGTSSTTAMNISGGTLVINGGLLRNAYGSSSTSTITVSTGGFILGNGTVDVVGAGSGTVTIFGTTIGNISSGTMTNGGTMTIPLFSSFVIDDNGTLVNNSTINNNGTLLLLTGGTFTNNGTLNGEVADWTIDEIAIDSGNVTTIPAGLTLPVTQDQTLYINGEIRNLSSSTLNIYGNVYTYSYLNNGNASNPGTINIYNPGALYALSGLIENKHADSEINVESGGSLYNYYGTVDISTGGSDSLNINNGGKFDNVRGNYPGPFTVSSGGNFSDFNEITLDKNLDIDYTWTLTEVSVINGYGNIITLGANGEIVIGDNASLLLNEVIINDVSGNKIHCTDNNSTLSIHNVTWTQDANFTYTKGKIYVSGDWLIQGKNTEFTYESDQEITVASDAAMHMFMTTFNFNSDTPSLLNLSNDTSIIHLEHGILKASKACSLSNGTLQVTGLGTCQGDATLNLQNLDSIDIVGGFLRSGTVVV